MPKTECMAFYTLGIFFFIANGDSFPLVWAKILGFIYTPLYNPPYDIHRQILLTLSSKSISSCSLPFTLTTTLWAKLTIISCSHYSNSHLLVSLHRLTFLQIFHALPIVTYLESYYCFNPKNPFSFAEITFYFSLSSLILESISLGPTFMTLHLTYESFPSSPIRINLLFHRTHHYLVHILITSIISFCLYD